FVEETAAVVFGFGARVGAALGRATLTSPRIARPDDRAFAAAFTVGRRVGLLREVEAMGTTLVTVAASGIRPVTGYTRTTVLATAILWIPESSTAFQSRPV